MVLTFKMLNIEYKVAKVEVEKPSTSVPCVIMSRRPVTPLGVYVYSLVEVTASALVSGNSDEVHCKVLARRFTCCLQTCLRKVGAFNTLVFKLQYYHQNFFSEYSRSNKIVTSKFFYFKVQNGLRIQPVI